ncbi:MAG: hypothetical protein M1834_009039 [Cirrosporium novae-zelandiae]|nr:MAG: hypothetical protein M1834_009039 [Cirrosporium novae-zelandiae]
MGVAGERTRNILLSEAKAYQSKPLLLLIAALDECYEQEVDQGSEYSILQKASDIFMWVILVVALLSRAYDNGKIEAMHQTLHEAPPGLEEVFGALLGKDSLDKNETILMLQWVLFNRRSLKPEELYFATIAGTDTQKLGAWKRSKITSDDIRRRITCSSKGLIEIRKGQVETVQFIYESVNDFLIRNRRLEMLDPKLQSNDAATYVLDHTEEAQARCIEQKDFIQGLRQVHGEFERLRRFYNAFEKHINLECEKGIKLLDMLSRHGYYKLTKTILLENEVDVNAQGGTYSNALHAALVNENTEIVTVLLENNANINAQGGIFGNALQAAFWDSSNENVARLLEKGANIDN